MDRLICGDVGYGKTEIAIRAAFKAVQDGKQVAVLVPTTILAEQHLHTFAERLADFPVKIEALSRFRTAKEQSRVLERLAAGEVDIIVGTHRVLSPDVKFQRPGADRGGRGAALRGEAQGVAQAAAPHGGRADADGHAHPAHPALLAAGAARHDAHPDAAARPPAGDHPRAALDGRRSWKTPSAARWTAAGRCSSSTTGWRRSARSRRRCRSWCPTRRSAWRTGRCAKRSWSR